ncbi:DUF6168 family protein [Arenibacter sp. M-2]|uniref:DUF6168 family protein n=1 Tax=unclassified Arenibacter TaxID=2615047 RepID=UPI000D7675B5|nr:MULTISPECIES: DUF6168 family protein [unclassified Arenibacter]MDL5510227.1 DUF6168 family protein [Arenibacter sp. M-2]PXX27793.1 hypothetical protein C7972_106143 [Arenibacter sp. ARW7G5Y1]
MSKNKFLFTFYLSLVLLSFLVFCLHLLILYLFGFPLLDHMIVLAYLLNVVLALIIFSVLYWFREKWRDQIGFLFLGGSMLKFLFFFLVFYPFYSADGNMQSLEFTTFFVPYLVCLLLETIFTARMLNS